MSQAVSVISVLRFKSFVCACIERSSMSQSKLPLVASKSEKKRRTQETFELKQETKGEEIRYKYCYMNCRMFINAQFSLSK
ncbi:hypothetical protein RRG08_067247 [Elysia crispata]|uniref:Uncharacterized protein n=1 Tax=Elysia crispata TaxID=231223 RepID=A0AAE0Z8N8_9GAST|nr:hypothetical protein RRG08_067247 [Elysia crispata]